MAGLGLKRGEAYKRKREEYFFEYVRQQLIDRYGEKRVQQGGFRVYTTIDPVLQSAARTAIKENLYADGDPDAAIVMVDSKKGYIRAMASSQAFNKENQFNLATQALRQPGSTFKTFVLTAGDPATGSTRTPRSTAPRSSTSSTPSTARSTSPPTPTRYRGRHPGGLGAARAPTTRSSSS